MRWLIVLARWAPAFLAAWFARVFLDPQRTAALAAELPARVGARIVRHLPPDFVAQACVHFDARMARDLIRALPLEKILPIAQAMLARGDYATLGRFVDVLDDASIQAILGAVPGEESLLRIAYHVTSRNRLDHLVRLMPHERLLRAILLILDPQRDLMREVLALVTSVGYTMQRELGDLAAAQETAVLDRIVQAADDHGLWAQLLPVIAQLSGDSQCKVVNLPVLRARPAVLQHILAATDRQELWSMILPLVPMMDEAMRDAVAAIAAAQTDDALQRASDAALMGEHWRPLMDVVRRMPEGRQRAIAAIVRAYGTVDPELLERVRRDAAASGLDHLFDDSQPKAA